MHQNETEVEGNAPRYFSTVAKFWIAKRAAGLLDNFSNAEDRLNSSKALACKGFSVLAARRREVVQNDCKVDGLTVKK